MAVRQGVARPPLGVLIKYRFFGSRLPERYLRWAEDDITSGRFMRARATLPILLMVASQLVFGAIRRDFDSVFPLLMFGFGYLMCYVIANGSFTGKLDTLQNRQMLQYQRGEIERADLDGASARQMLMWALGGLLVGGLIVLAFAAFS